MADDYYPCRLYLVSPQKFTLSSFLPKVEAAFAGGDVGAFQLRMKEASDAQIIEAAEALMPLAAKAGAAFILNDRVDLVAKLRCDGVHLGQDDMKVAEARSLLHDGAVIGVSCHDSGHMAMEAGEAGADYVAFGAFFATTSKSPEKLAKYGTPTAEILQWWQTYTTLPAVAIGGVTPENCGPLVAAGADFVAAITSVWKHAQGPTIAVRAFNAAIKEGLKQRMVTAA